MTDQPRRFTPWDNRELPALLSPEEATRRGQVFLGLTEELAGLLEGWAGKLGSGDAEKVLTTTAEHLRWHAKLWKEDILEGKGSGDTSSLSGFLKELGSATEPVEVLTGVYRVTIPRLIAALTFHQRALNIRTDPATHRFAPMMLKDLFDAVRDGELLLQSLLTTPADVESSSTRRAALETILVNAGGIAGPGTLGDLSTTGAQEVTVR